MTTKAVHPLVGRVSQHQDGEDMLYVLDGEEPTFGYFPCVLVLHDFDGHDVAAYVIIGYTAVSNSARSWRGAAAAGSTERCSLFGPYPDVDTAILTYKLVHENEVARLLKQAKKE